ncbi:C-C chemokine receptor type 8-like [Brienomyrus brachyistius]|uniref:C-C chemokine receptor type 8-like n=1 Tax=Brienomyrus brachyistius TaxID=42636 RepID=UPI0020B28F63|nr:C-C chemokine receptor type 8-like [Brienomyrus brachyistius]
MSAAKKTLWNATPSTGISTLEYSDYYDYENDSLIFLEDDDLERFGGVFSGVFYCLIFTFSLAGNSLLFCTLLKFENLQRAPNMFLMNLTVSDLIFTLPLPFWAVYQLHDWVFGEVACKIFSMLFFIGFYSYMTFLVIMAVDRYTAVVRDVMSWKVRQRRKLHAVCIGAWIFCITASLPEVLLSETKLGPNGTLCESVEYHHSLRLFMYYLHIVVFFLVPFAVILYCYVRIWTRIWKCKAKKKQQAIKLILGIIIGFFICWAPYNIVLFIQSLYLQHGAEQANISLNYAYYVCHCLAYSHCCLNPFLHIFGSEKFRGQVYLICDSKHHPQSNQSFTSQNASIRTSVSRQTYV